MLQMIADVAAITHTAGKESYVCACSLPHMGTFSYSMTFVNAAVTTARLMYRVPETEC